MKIINQLVVQSDMPNDNNVVWVYGNTAKYYNNGTWTTLGESNEDRKELEEKVDSLDKEMGEVKKDLSILGSKQGVVELEIGDGEVTKGEEFTLKDFTSELNNKVDKVKGKQLSTNDYTTAEKNKLANLQNYTLPIATKNILGGVKAITNIADLNADTATIDQVAGVINNLLAQFRTSGLIQS